MSKNKEEYLTEKQRMEDGPLVVDLDFRYEYNVDEKMHTEEEVLAHIYMIIYMSLPKKKAFLYAAKLTLCPRTKSP